MIVLDYIIANEDRHLNNFGAVRNVETLEWLGFAPIYDSGSSLGYDKMPAQMRSEKEVVCKPFKNHHEEQLKLVSDFRWIDFNSLADVETFITGVLSMDGAEDYMEENRIRTITRMVRRRIEQLSQQAAGHAAARSFSVQDDVETSTRDDVETSTYDEVETSTQDDVDVDIAADYT